jgi:lysophospholipase L1-like esterase
MSLKNIFTVIIILTFSKAGFSQKNQEVKFVKAETLTMVGKMMPTKNIYSRIDSGDFPKFTPTIKRLLTNSAGLALAFSTDSKSIDAKWCNSNSKPASNMTPIAHKGLDLYMKIDGKWQFAGVGRPSSQCSNFNLIKNMKPGVKEFLLYLPLYDSIDSVQIGIDANASIKPIKDPFAKRILCYGSSILHGASASRSGLAYPAKLSRQTGLNFINMGISGNAKMEKEVADLVANTPADAYILDCIPNPSPEQIKERTAYLVRTIRAKHPKAPIILMQSVIRELSYVNTVVGTTVAAQNAEASRQYDALIKEGIKDFYFIKADDFIGHDHEGTTDGVHPNDLGFDRMVEVIRPQIMTILSKYGIK